MLVALSGLLGMAFFIFFLSEQINPLIFYALFLIIETILVFEEITWKLVCVTITEIYAIDAMIQQMYAIILVKRNLVNGNMGLRIVFIFMVLGVFLELALLLLLAATGEIYKEKDFLNQKYLKLQESHYKYLEQRETATKKFRHEEETFMLCIRNSFDGKLIKKNGNIQTRKQDKEIHGYGLLNVKECVERNQGHIHIQQQKAEFVVTIFLKVEGKSSIEIGRLSHPILSQTR